jgi:hypothetical protein
MKLQSEKLAVEVVVVDHIERVPTKELRWRAELIAVAS